MGRGNKLKVLDLYSGCGGLGLGFELTGAFESIGGVDHYQPAIDSFYANRELLARNVPEFTSPVDLGSATAKELLRVTKASPDVIVGGPPCQGFSFAGPRLKHDERNEHVWNFQQVVLDARPAAFVMENVSGLLVTGQKKRADILEQLAEGYEEAGYRDSWPVLNSMNFRVPQQRKRLFLVGLRDGSEKFEFPEPPCGGDESLFRAPEPYVTVGEALDDMPSPVEAEPQPYEKGPSTWFQRYVREGSDFLLAHRPTNHKPEMVERLRKQEQGTKLYPNWNHSWYRLDPKRPSPAVKANNRAPFVHHLEPRCVSSRECARLQSFPDNYVIGFNKTAELIQIGNAVPPLLAASVATKLASYLGAEDKVIRPDGLSEKIVRINTFYCLSPGTISPTYPFYPNPQENRRLKQDSNERRAGALKRATDAAREGK